jgi:hypothetical protein
MQRFEIVADAIGKIDRAIVFVPSAKYWDLDEQKTAMKKTEAVMDSVVEMSDLLKSLIYHEYPIKTMTVVQPEHPGEMNIIASTVYDPPSLLIEFSPALLGAIADSKEEPFLCIEQAVMEDVQKVLYMTVDYVDAKICKERAWLDYLCEVVE